MDRDQLRFSDNDGRLDFIFNGICNILYPSSFVKKARLANILYQILKINKKKFKDKKVYSNYELLLEDIIRNENKDYNRMLSKELWAFGNLRRQIIAHCVHGTDTKGILSLIKQSIVSNINARYDTELWEKLKNIDEESIDRLKEEIRAIKIYQPSLFKVIGSLSFQEISYAFKSKNMGITDIPYKAGGNDDP